MIQETSEHATVGLISALTTYLWGKTEYNWHQNVSVSLQRTSKRKSKRQVLPPGSVTLMRRCAGLGWSAQCNVSRRFCIWQKEREADSSCQCTVFGYASCELLETTELVERAGERNTAAVQWFLFLRDPEASRCFYPFLESDATMGHSPSHIPLQELWTVGATLSFLCPYCYHSCSTDIQGRGNTVSTVRIICSW